MSDLVFVGSAVVLEVNGVTLAVPEAEAVGTEVLLPKM